MILSTHENSLFEGTDFFTKYHAGEVLGDGISSVVRRCVDKKTGKEYAVKVIDKLSKRVEDVKGIDTLTQVRSEVNALSQLKGHPHIITLKDYFESSAFLFLVFELAKGGELFDYLTRQITLSEKVSRKLMWQLLGAVKYIHSHDIVHRDLKPENILLDEKENLLLSDFGFAAKLENGEQLFDVLGTPAYFAPETLRCVVDDVNEGYGKAVDLWACGVILFTLLVGQSPFWHRRETIMYRRIMGGDFSFKSREWDDVSEGPKDLIKKLLVVDPKKRLTAAEALELPWFKGAELRAEAGRPKLRFKTFVYTILSLKKLYYTFHERYLPMSFKSALNEPYAFKDLRKLIDSCAFTMYGHWVKRTSDQLQNRNALFANLPKREIVGSLDYVDGESAIFPLYSYDLTHAFSANRGSFTKKATGKSVNQKN